MDKDIDQALMQRCRQGDRAAFSALVTRYQRPVYHAVYRILGNREDARDVTQTVFLKVAERVERYDPKYRFFSWLYRIAVNESIDAMRRNGRERTLQESDEESAPEADGPEQRLDQQQQARRIESALRMLKPDDRVVISLRHFADCSYQDIAQILAIDEKTVKSRLFDARRRLAQRLHDLRIPSS